MKDTKMLFDGKQTEYKSELHEKIYAMGRLIVPFEVSTANITDKVMLEGLRQVYDFTVELFSDMYENPDKFKITYERKLIEGKSFYENTGTPRRVFSSAPLFFNSTFHKTRNNTA